MVVRLPEGAIGGAGPEHSQCPEATLLQHPGAYITIPATPYDAKGLLKSAIRDDNPVCFFENKALYNDVGEVPEEEYTIPLGQADLKRQGGDVSIIAWGRMVGRALEAAEQVAKDGVDVEVLDLRGLRPLDVDAIIATVEKTGRVIISHEAPKTGGGGGEIAAIIAEEALTALDAPIRRVCGQDVPIPQSMRLEQYVIPSTDDLVLGIKEVTA
jgi:pyruvate/2-oxoglutarate/acetoin dehydrogenase E1 component